MVCLDLAVRPTGRVKYLLCCVFSCKGAGTKQICKFNILRQLAVCQQQVLIVYVTFTIHGDNPPMMDFISTACSLFKAPHTSISSSRWRTVSHRCCKRLESMMNTPPPAPIFVQIGYSNSSTRISFRMVCELTENSKARLPRVSFCRSYKTAISCLRRSYRESLSLLFIAVRIFLQGHILLYSLLWLHTIFHAVVADDMIDTVRNVAAETV